MPIALSMPCTGRGGNVCQREKPASRTLREAAGSSRGEVHSASKPCSGAFPSGRACVGKLSVGWVASLMTILMMFAVGLRGRVECLHLGHRDHRQVAAEQEEQREEEPEA